MENKKIIIIGCSISGGLFARRLLQLHPNANIKIYEKWERIKLINIGLNP
jgi:protoporphyrinogen oxidase